MKKIILSIIFLSFCANVYALNNWGGKAVDGWNVDANLLTGSMKIKVIDNNFGDDENKINISNNISVTGNYGANNWQASLSLGTQKLKAEESEYSKTFTVYGLKGKYNLPMQNPLDLTGIIFLNKSSNSYTHYGLGLINTFKEINIFKPYAGIGLKKFEFDNQFVFGGTNFTETAKNKNIFNIIIGSDIEVFDNFNINAEINLISENTFSFGGSYKF